MVQGVFQPDRGNSALPLNQIELRGVGLRGAVGTGTVSHVRHSSRLAAGRDCHDCARTRSGACPRSWGRRPPHHWSDGAGTRANALGWAIIAELNAADAPRLPVDGRRRHYQRAAARSAVHGHDGHAPFRGGGSGAAGARDCSALAIPVDAVLLGRLDRREQPGALAWEPERSRSKRPRRRWQIIGRLHGVLGGRDAYDEERVAGSVQANAAGISNRALRR